MPQLAPAFLTISEVSLRQGAGDRRASLMLLWLTLGAHPARVPRRLGSTRPPSATRPWKRALLVFAMPARSDWLHAHAIRRKRPDVHDVDVRARAATSAVCARVRARLRVVEREPRFLVGLLLQLPFGLLALLVARVLLRVVERIADALARHPTLRGAATAPPRPREAVDLPQIPALALGYAERGPPTF
jgi:hypothetical protein